MNAEEVARELKCSSKTVLRHIKKGTITATHKNAQELEITEDQVEILRRVLASKSGQSTDMSGQIEKLTARLSELEERVRTLESRHVPTDIPRQSVPVPSTSAIPPKSQPQKSRSDASIPVPADLPPGTLTSSDFIAHLGIDKEEFKRYMKRGVYGDKLDMTEIPHHSREGYTHKYFTLEQQKRAIELLRKHGKLDTN